MPDIASLIEQTLLRADATPDEVVRHCAEAASHRLFGVCVSPVYVALAKRALSGTPLRIVTVAGFPLGTSAPSVKAVEARRAVDDGADEVDMVMAIGLARAGDWGAVAADVRAVRDAMPGRLLKVILETGYFDAGAITLAARAAVEGGADFVKTSTGFGPRGASVDDVRTLVAAVAGRARVKASGGIRSREAADLLVAAGADRLGTSSGPVLVSG
jgi:deoxyribose-phosphate aldolase